MGGLFIATSEFCQLVVTFQGVDTAHTRLISTKRFTNLNLDVIVIDKGFHFSYEFEFTSTNEL